MTTRLHVSPVNKCMRITFKRSSIINVVFRFRRRWFARNSLSGSRIFSVLFFKGRLKLGFKVSARVSWFETSFASVV